MRSGSAQGNTHKRKEEVQEEQREKGDTPERKPRTDALLRSVLDPASGPSPSAVCLAYAFAASHAFILKLRVSDESHWGNLQECL